MNGNSVLSPEKFSCLAAGRNWPGMVLGQTINGVSVGVCDEVLALFTNGVTLYAMDSVDVKWSVAAAGANLILPVGQTVAVFAPTGGPGTPIAGGFGQLKGANNSNILSTGSPAEEGFIFIGTGASVTVGLPFQQSATGGQTPTSANFYGTWLKPDDDGSMYSQRLQYLTLKLCSAQLSKGNMGCSYNLGGLEEMAAGGLRAGGHFAYGECGVPGGYLPFQTPIGIASSQDLSAASVQVIVGTAGEIQSDATNATQGLGANLAVYVEVRFHLWGYFSCYDTASLCGGLSLEDQITLKNMLINGTLQGLPAPTPAAGAR